MWDYPAKWAGKQGSYVTIMCPSVRLAGVANSCTCISLRPQRWGLNAGVCGPNNGGGMAFSEERVIVSCSAKLLALQRLNAYLSVHRQELWCACAYAYDEDTQWAYVSLWQLS